MKINNKMKETLERQPTNKEKIDWIALYLVAISNHFGAIYHFKKDNVKQKTFFEKSLLYHDCKKKIYIQRILVKKWPYSPNSKNY
jgi:hypothetical protein